MITLCYREYYYKEERPILSGHISAHFHFKTTILVDCLIDGINKLTLDTILRTLYNACTRNIYSDLHYRYIQEIILTLMMSHR